MSSPGFDDVLKRKINEEDLEYNPALWERLLQNLPKTLSPQEFDARLREQVNDEVLPYNPAHWEQLAAQLPWTLGTTEFDEGIKQKVANNHLEYHSESWSRFAAKLPFPVIEFPSRRNTLKRLSGIAALFLIAVAATVFLMNKKQQDIKLAAQQHPADSGLAAHTLPPNNNTAPTTVNTPTNTTTADFGNNNTNTTTATIARTYNGITQPLVTADTVLNGIPQNSITLNPISNPAIVLQNIHPGNTLDNSTYNAVTQHNVQAAQPMPEMYYPDSYNPEQDKKLYYHKTSLALNGGANYGTFRQGLTVGFSARHFVNDKVFIDGAIAMMINHGDDNTLNYTGDVMKDVFSNNSSNGRSARPSGTYYNVNNFYYIQFNPSVGTKLSKRFMVSTGPDFQQLLTSSPDPTIMFKDHDVKLVPNFDVGLTGKAEFFLSPSIQTGIIYRQGVNNIIRNNNDYLNRNYFQIELKYTLPLSITQ